MRFEPVAQPSTVLWWVEVGERPTVDAALRRRFGPDGRPEGRPRPG